MKNIIEEIKQCTLCQAELPLGANPVVQFSSKSKIAVIGQAPGIRVHKSNLPWNDPSGDRLRNWLGVDRASFYNTDNFALVPMGFCYPGTGKNGDLPPMKICAPTWHQKVWDFAPTKLTLLIGNYAQKYYLKKRIKKNLTETVQSFEEYLPEFLVLPHPSPRNNIWLKKNPWFEQELIPILKLKVREVLPNLHHQ